MKKNDALISAILGFFIGIFLFIVLKNLEVKISYLWLAIVAFPFLSILGIYIVSVLGKRFLIIYQAGKFLLVGALNTLVDLGILNILIWLTNIASGPWYPVFKGISFLVAVINSYFWNRKWTFEKKGELFVPGEFSKFLMVTAIGFLFNVGVASLVVNIVGPQFGMSAKLWASVGAVSAALVAWIWNFLSSKFIVFKK
ncbi:MAG: GtrA family protein [bacterium]|nr:GtrA family protein [bacterium]